MIALEILSLGRTGKTITLVNFLRVNSKIQEVLKAGFWNG